MSNSPLYSVDRAEPVRRWLLGALLVALVVHAGVLLAWLAGLVQRPDVPRLSWTKLAPAAAVGAGIVVVALRAFRNHVRKAIAIALLVAAFALVSIGAVAVVLLLMLSAHVVGRAVLEWVAAPGRADSQTGRPDDVLTLLTGACLWIALIGATIGLQIHYAPLYVLVVAGSLIAFRNHARASLAATAQWLDSRREVSRVDAVWLAVAATVVLIHFAVAGKPEVGYDASTMHLQFSELVAHDHRWQFDVGRYVWAVMPMGADYAYLAAYLLDGERAARLLNLAFGALACAIIYRLIRRQANRDVALGSVCLLTSTPLWFLESGTLFVEFAWMAFLVAALASTLAFVERADARDFATAALTLAGAMQCKVIGVFWALPLAAALIYRAVRLSGKLPRRSLGVCAAALLIGAWPYVNAWLRTGNPVFPFMNNVFRSPLYDATQAFANSAWTSPLGIAMPYDLVLTSGRYLEGTDGAAGVHWLLLFPVIAFGLVVKGAHVRRWTFALAATFVVIVYLQQSYLRYLMPAFALLAVLGGWTLGDWVRTPRVRGAFAATGASLVLVNCALMPTASSQNETLCAACALDASRRADYVARYAPLRVVADYLNDRLPNARVGLFVLNGPGPSGFVGYSRGANWHDVDVYPALTRATGAESIAAVSARYRLTHAVFVDRSDDPLDRVLLDYRDRYTRPVARIGNYVVTEILGAPGG